MGTVEKLTLENMGIAFGILSLGGTEPEIHLGEGSFTPPSNCEVRFKKYHCNTRVKHSLVYSARKFAIFKFNSQISFHEDIYKPIGLQQN